VIVTVTLNPVLHVDYAADKITPGASNPVRRVRYRAGGRGLAVARVLNTFGHDVVAAGLIGGSAGELIRNELARAGVPAQFTSITAESRRMVTVSDESDGVATSFAEPAPYITTEELGRLASDYLGLLADATAVVLCGSLPEGLPPEIYGSFVSYAAGASVPVILDAGGSALAHGAARRPALVVPDLPEQEQEVTAVVDVAAEPAGEPSAKPSSVALLSQTGVRILSAAGEWRVAFGRRAALGGQPGEAFRDALVAGFVPGIALAWSWPDTLRHAVALAQAWSADGELDVTAYEEALTAVNVQKLPSGYSS